MTKPRWVTGSLGALTLAAIFAVGFSALVTPTADAGNCLCPPDTYEFREWGHGASCAAAKADCLANAEAAADSFCQGVTAGDSCAFVSIDYDACYASYTVDCDATVRCEECIQFP